MAMQIRRTPTPDAAPTGLAAGQLSVEMASVPPRLWVGVPNTIDASGRVQVNNMLPLTGGTLSGALTMSAASPINLTGLNGSVRSLFWQTALVNRWQFATYQTETGGNSGSDFSINRYSDAGIFIDAPLNFIRSTGQIYSGNIGTGNRVEINAMAALTGMGTGTLFVNRNVATVDNQSPQLNMSVNVSHSGNNLYATERVSTLVSGNTPTWALWNYTNCQANSDATWVVGTYNQQVRTAINPGGLGRGAALWSEVDEVRSTTGLPSSQDGILLPVEIDIFANGLDDLSPAIGRTHLSIVLGQHNSGGAPVEATTGISFYMMGADQGWWKSLILCAAYSYCALDTRWMALPSHITDPFAAVKMKVDQVIEFDGTPAGPDNTDANHYLQYTETGTRRLRYMDGANERWSITDPGAMAFGAAPNNTLTVTPGATAADAIVLAQSGTAGIQIAAGLTMLNNQRITLRDTAGTGMSMVVAGNNYFSWYATDATGADRQIATMPMRDSTLPFYFTVPVQLSPTSGLILVNNVRLSFNDTAGSQAQFFAGAGNFMNFNATGSTGAARTVFSIPLRSDTSALGFSVPLSLDTTALVNAADDTAAAAAGVAVRSLYHNAGAVRVRIA